MDSGVTDDSLDLRCKLIMYQLVLDWVMSYNVSPRCQRNQLFDWHLFFSAVKNM